MSAARWVVLGAAALAAVLATLVGFAPASLVDRALDEASLGRVRLADASGSIWRGSGRFVLSEGPGPADAGPVVQGFALPGTLRWELRALPLLFGLIDASVASDTLAQTVRISGQPGELRLSAGSLDLPSAQLARLGSPWNTIQPAAAVSLRWDALTIRNGVIDGRASIELRDVASAMTPVRPLGTYRIDVNGNGRDVALTLATLSGPLRLQGSGSWDRRAGVRFTAEAQAEGPERQRLSSLLGLVGRREGERTIIRIGG